MFVVGIICRARVHLGDGRETCVLDGVPGTKLARGHPTHSHHLTYPVLPVFVCAWFSVETFFSLANFGCVLKNALHCKRDIKQSSTCIYLQGTRTLRVYVKSYVNILIVAQDANETSNEEEKEGPPSLKKARVKIERDPRPRLRRNGSGRDASAAGPDGASLQARARRGANQPWTVGGGGGGSFYGEEGGGDDGDDPLAPYDRIAASTVDDEGLEELLHTGRRDGYLDLRRYRKPGWPRPRRITRLEASHGKR